MNHGVRPAIRTDRLTRTFGSVEAVKGLSIEVPAGSVFGFLGPNGSGKTTTIRLLLGLVRPTGGSAEILGHDVERAGTAIRQATGALLEHSGIYERLTALENLEFYGRVRGLGADERRERARELLSHFGLYERRHDGAGTWSRGMKQKLAIARALFHRPALVFLDEPTEGLDPASAASLRADIAGLAEEFGTTVFLTTHNLSEAEKVCDYIGLIRDGELMAFGALDSLRSGGREKSLRITGRAFEADVLERVRRHPGVTDVSCRNGSLIVSSRNGTDRAGIVRTIVEAGGEIEGVGDESRSLEDAYLEIMGGGR